MSTPIEYQRIEHDGKPAYVLVPWEDWQRIKKVVDAQRVQTSGIPQAVVEEHVLRDDSLVKACGVNISALRRKSWRGGLASLKPLWPNSNIPGPDPV